MEFSANDQICRGISSNFSLGGIFIRTNYPFAPGTTVHLIIHLPDGKDSRVKGVVKTAVKTPLAALKNGMGLEITEKDSNYVDFVQKELESDKERSEGPTGKGSAPVRTSGMTDPQYMIVTCAQCGVKNRVRRSRISLGVQCGKCSAILKMD